MQKKYFIAFCLILFIISIAVVSASDIEQTDADTDVLSVSNEYKLSNGVDSGTFDELQKKINNASEGSTIEFFNNYTYDDTFEAKGIMINKSLTIEGNGFTIDGANKARIFFIDATNNITLNNIVFKNAISPEGSAILFNKSIENITISNSVFSNNIVPNDGHGGGAISFNNDVSGLLFENDTFENNYAPLGYGGSIVFDGNTTNVTFNSSTFRVNKPREKDITGGGAIYFIGDAVLISIDNCEFDNITARTGGAIYVEGSFDTSLIHNTKFTNNKAFTDNLDYGGGAIYVEGNASSIHIFNSNFINNTAKTHGGAILFNNSIENITISNSVFSNNIVPNDGHGGGAISFNNDVSGLLFENDTFENNYAPLGYGGSIVFDGNTTNVTFNSSTFRVNKPREKDITGGGAIYFIGDAVLISIDNCEFDNITARTGGAIYVEGSFDTSLIHNTKFTNNKAFTDNLDYGGGAIAVEGNASSIHIFNSDFINNTAKTHGGAIKFMANDELNTFDGCIFYNNYAPYGGAVALGNTDYLVISESSFTNHIGAEDDIVGGGAIYVIGNLTNANIVDSLFENNSARAGGAIYVENNMNQVQIYDTYFINNSASSNNTFYGGGAIAVEEDATNNFFDSVTFVSNIAQTHGGAIKFMGNDEYNTFDGCIFYNNYAPYGGAIAVANDSICLNLTDCLFGINDDEYPLEIIGGGALYFINDTYSLVIDGSSFYGLSARAGGAIYVEGDLNTADINGSNFIGNKATTNNTKYGGGAIAVEGNSNVLILTECNFINNSATIHGGAIKLQGNNTYTVIDKSKFDSNYAPYGGAVALGNTDYLVISESSFTNHIGAEDDIVGGGAIYVIGNLTNANIVDSLFENNSARAGGAIFVEDNMEQSKFYSNSFINNSAFTNNTLYGGGAIAVEDNSTNNIFNGTMFILNSGSTHGGTINFMGNDINNTIYECEFINNYGRYGTALAVNKNSENLNITKSVFASFNESSKEVIAGGALYFINNITNLYIADCNFSGNVVRAGGAIYVEKKIEKSLIENCLFKENTITTANEEYGGGAIFVEGSAFELAIKCCEFINNTASTRGGAIYIHDYAKDFLIDDSLFSGNNADSAKAIYLNDGDNVTIQNSRFINNNGSDGDILFKGKITASVINSSFEGEGHINICEDAAVTLSNNMELDSFSSGDYFVYNEGVLALENNSLINVIFNNGEITSPTTMTTLFNQTINTTDSLVWLYATCIDDNKNYIVSEYGTFYLNNYSIDTFYNERNYLSNYYDLGILYDSYLVNTTMLGLLSNCTYEYSIINYIHKKEPNMNVSDIEVDFGQYAEIEVVFPEDATGVVSAFIGDEVYMAAVKDGKATLIIPPLEAGDYRVIIEYSGDENYEYALTFCTLTVNDKITVEAPDVTKYYHGPERFVVNVAQSGEPIANATVDISINGQTYTKTTDENGTASIALVLSSGNYNVTVKVDDITVNSTVTVLPTVNGTDITKIYRNGTQYYATFVDSEGNYLKNGTTVTFNINGVFYNRTITGNKGLARLNINLIPGEYIITAINPNTSEQASNVIKVLSRIIENKDITKYFRNGTQYSVKVLDDEGNVVGAGESVEFNINGVFYERKTDKNGIATLNINLPPDDYIITAEYKESKVSNNIKVLPVLTADDLIKQYGTDDPFEAKLVDGQGNPYADQKVGFNINGVFYHRYTDSKGIVRLSINLPPGEYIISSEYEYAVISNKITIVG